MSEQRFGIRIPLETKYFFVLLSTVEVKWPSVQLITSLCECMELYLHSLMLLPVFMFN